jgi:peptidoglycan/LPS O-acetylase OafA/YrhL
MLLAVLSVWYSLHHNEPGWLGHRIMPWASWIGAGLAFVWVSHVVTDHDILYFVLPRVNLERQFLYGVVAFLLLLPAVFGPPDQTLIRKFLRCWPVASVGVISYGIYLWHLNLMDQFLKWADWNPLTTPIWLLSVVVLGITIGVASISYFGLERPLLRLKNRLGWWSRRVNPTLPTPSESPQVTEPAAEATASPWRGADCSRDSAGMAAPAEPIAGGEHFAP